MTVECRECGTKCITSKGILKELVDSRGMPAKWVGRGTTISRQGEASLVECNKCPECGHSWIK